MLVGKPTAGSFEIEIQVAHHQIDGPARGSADEAAEGVLTHLERQAGVVIGMKRAETFMMRNLESKSLCDPLNGEVAELLKFYSIHNYAFMLELAKNFEL